MYCCHNAVCSDNEESIEYPLVGLDFLWNSVSGMGYVEHTILCVAIGRIVGRIENIEKEIEDKINNKGVDNKEKAQELLQWIKTVCEQTIDRENSAASGIKKQIKLGKSAFNEIKNCTDQFLTDHGMGNSEDEKNKVEDIEKLYNKIKMNVGFLRHCADNILVDMDDVARRDGIIDEETNKLRLCLCTMYGEEGGNNKFVEIIENMSRCTRLVALLENKHENIICARNRYVEQKCCKLMKIINGAGQA